ncbi:alpha-L-rhamnosidase-like protein [Anaerobacterium chartisolvens]|uniref:Alpha-L-rhamnosidase-like protein n=1 Tax=Anaerobacterium chartisolvens TaxID=1297424 RepID=A0A369B8P2_9FIRM|nr:family 78 glycoside hydrolase catalytic domain [Anaerobacterium chartisolvens]RCX17893.1 alpha-L-rhamnosidase-like protein [Anaerobacterium chartisolvens]
MKIQTVEMELRKNDKFLKIAEGLKPRLIQKVIYPKDIVKVVRDKTVIHGWKVNKADSIDNLREYACGRGDKFILDFGAHEVGYLTMKIRPVGSPPDAPLRLKLIFGEMPCEVKEPFSEYNGWISSSWLQEEIINIDILPQVLSLPRRYSFRYLKAEVIDTSPKYKVSFDEIYCKTVTSADLSAVKELPSMIDKELIEIDRVSIKTLQDCMQEVFEDGPKRDRRLWIGDLRLQAIANYKTFKNYDLVKRCLYLFAGITRQDGQISSCLFIEPEVTADNTFLYDYSLLFVDCLYSYYKATGDMETLKDLWESAYRQIEIALERLDENNIERDDNEWWAFIDWHEDLNKQTPAQAVLIYCMKRALKLSEELDFKEKDFLKEKVNQVSAAAITYLWDKEKGFFVSGKTKQISWASQIWMVLAEVLTKEENEALMERLFEKQPKLKLTTPYAYHHLVDALILTGKKDFAIEQIKAYWGEMIKDGADTFWELYNPEDKNYSPYGSNLINSYCHAWSCTPTYFIRNYFMQENCILKSNLVK